jgi:hypothetical protein
MHQQPHNLPASMSLNVMTKATMTTVNNHNNNNNKNNHNQINSPLCDFEHVSSAECHHTGSGIKEHDNGWFQ